MAYRAEIEIAVKGANRLSSFQGKLDATALAVDNLNKFLKNFSDNASGISRSISNLSGQLGQSAKAFNDVALGTQEARTAAVNYLEATRNLNAGLRERAALLAEVAENERKAKLASSGIRERTQYPGPIGPGPVSSTALSSPLPASSRFFGGTQYPGAIGPGPVSQTALFSRLPPSSPLLSGQASDTGDLIRRNLDIKRDELVLEKALLKLKERRADAVFRELKNNEALVRSANEAKLIAAEARGERPSSQLQILSPEKQLRQEGIERAEQIARDASLKSKANQEEFAAQQRYAREIFNIEQGFNKKLRDQEIDTILDKIKLESDSQKELFNKALRNDNAILDNFDRRLKKRTDESEKQLNISKQMAKRRREAAGNALIGGAFPLLFGQGIGAAAGGAIGGGVGGLLGGQFGFGLSLVGTALGNTFDQLQAKAVAIGNALQNATGDMEGLRDAGISVTAELEAQVRLLNRYGDAQAAQQRVEQAVALQTGDIGGQGTRLAAGSANELQKAFEGVSAAAATTIGIIGAPFAQAIAAILRGVQAILVVFNAVITAATGLINLIPGAKALGDALFESSLKGTAEYEKRQNQLEQETETLTRTVKEQQKYNDALRAAGQLRNTDFKLSKQILDYRAKERQAVEAVLDKQQELGGGRTAEERARIEATLSAFRTLQNAKLTKERLENEREIITAQENNVKKINEINESTAKTYTDMRIKLERQIEDERINAIRRIQDAQLKSEKAVIDFREKELKLIQNQRKEQLEVSAALGQLEASFTGAPGREGIAAQLTAAVAQYKNGIIEADENRKLTEAKIQLDAKEAALAVERFKQDNARRVARINEDSARKIAEVNNRLDKQRNESFKYAYDLTVKRLIAQETAAKGQIEQSIAGQRALMGSPIASEAFKQESAVRISGLQAEIQNIEVTISRLQSLMSKLPKTPSIQGMGSLPSLTSQASEVSAAETALNSVLQKGRERLSQLTQENSERSAAAKLALKGINLVSTAAAKQANITNSLNEGNREAAQYIELLKSGVNPELAEQMAAITSASTGVENVIDQTVQQLEALNNPEFKELIDKLLELKSKQGDIVAGQIEAAKTSKRLEDEKEKLEKLKAIYTDLEKNVFKRLGTALEDALVGTIEAAVTGAKDLQETLQEIASSLLKDVGRMFIRAAISGAGTQLGLPGFADGGFAQPGRSYIVGERGPELLTMSASGGYVTNNSASQAAMDRYSSGNTRGGAISVNYNVTEINGMKFVTEDQFRAGISQAAKQGADGGFNRTMSSLKNSRSTRSRVGV